MSCVKEAGLVQDELWRLLAAEEESDCYGMLTLRNPTIIGDSVKFIARGNSVGPIRTIWA